MVFVSSELYTADLNGPRGADEICAELADAAGLGGYWMSWTSNRCTSPSKRFQESTIEYRLINGDRVAANWDELIDAELDRSIQFDGYGIRLTHRCTIPGENDFCFVWTNTDFDGTVHMNNRCRGLTWDEDSIEPPGPERPMDPNPVRLDPKPDQGLRPRHAIDLLLRAAWIEPVEKKGSDPFSWTELKRPSAVWQRVFLLGSCLRLLRCSRRRCR